MSLVVNCRFLAQQVTGVQRYAIEISRKLKHLWPEIRFWCPPNIYHKALAEELHAVSIGTLSGHLWEQIDLPRFLKKEESPILLNLANTAPIFYKKNVVTLHDLAVFRNPEWFSLSFRTGYRVMTPTIARKALAILTVSTSSKAEIETILHQPEGKIHVIPNAVPSGIMHLSQTTFPNRYGRYILAVSSLDPRKNFSKLLETFFLIPNKDLHLVLVGAESKIFANPDLKKKVKQLKNIIFTGYLEDENLVGLYQNALCLVYPSLYEGFGLPPIEAMACGCPVIASDIPVLRETCGNSAIYCNPHDPDDIARNITRVIQDEGLRADLHQKGSDQIRKFNWEISAQRIIDIITKSSLY